jgi:predicted nucleic acid-binding protein
MKKIFVDSDIVLDLFAERTPHYSFAARLFYLAEMNQLTVCISSLSFSNLFYILRKLKSKEMALRYLKKLKILVQVLAVDDKIIDLALASDFSDFEDAIQYYTAIENKIKLIVTRNTKDYKKSKITVCTAEEFLVMWNANP